MTSVRSSSVAPYVEVPGEAERDAGPDAMADEGEVERYWYCLDWSARALVARSLTLVCS